MAYSPTTVSASDVISSATTQTNITGYRQEVNTTKLNRSDFTSDELDTRHIAKPRLLNHGGGLMEWRGESGGDMSVRRGPMNATHVEDRVVLNKSDAAYSMGLGFANPANSGYSRLTHEGGESGRTASATELAEVPGLCLTVDIPSPCRLILRAHSIINFLPSNNSAGTNHFTSTPIPQPLWLVQESYNTAAPSLVAAGHTSAFTQKAQGDIYLRNFYLNGFVNITTPGRYSFKVVANIQRNGSNGVESGIGLIGKTELTAEWWYTSSTNS